jgi:hypothetical protein
MTFIMYLKLTRIRFCNTGINMSHPLCLTWPMSIFIPYP